MGAIFDRVWRAAVHQAHPDTGGSNEAIRTVIAARERIKELIG